MANPLRSLLHWPSAAGHLLGNTVLPAVFGGGSAPSFPGEPNPLGNALSAAGAATVASAGGPRQFGTFGPSPLASISAGLAAGREVYQQAQGRNRSRQAYRDVVMPAEGPTQTYLAQLLQTAIDQNDPVTAREATAILASGNYVRPPVLHTPTELDAARADLARTQAYVLTHPSEKSMSPVSLSPGNLLVDPRTGQEIARGLPRPVATSGAGAPVHLSTTERQAAERVREALQQMIALHGQDATNAVYPVGSAIAEGAGHIPVVGTLLSGATAPMAQSNMTPDQQRFQRAAVQLRHNLAALSPHVRMSLGFLQDINKAYVPPAGTDPLAIGQSFAPEWTNVLGQMNTLLGGGQAPQAPGASVTEAAPAVPNYSRFRSHP